MPASFAVDSRAQCTAPPQKVWAILTDAPTWTAWAAGCHEAVVESGHELGEVRRFRIAPLAGLPWPRLTVRERTTGYDPPHHLAYEMLAGLPGVTDYTAHVTLADTAGGGTDIGWHVTFDSKIPGLGPVIRWKLEHLYGDTAGGLARAAQR